MHNTLHEFTFDVKTIGYIVAAVVLVLFIPFYLFLTDREKKE